jgi:hypothetical protein
MMFSLNAPRPNSRLSNKSAGGGVLSFSFKPGLVVVVWGIYIKGDYFIQCA